MNDKKADLSYNDVARRNGSGLCRDATMLRDSLVGSSHRCGAAWKRLTLPIISQNTVSGRKTPCLENPRPAGAETSLTENVTSPFQAEPAHRRYNFGTSEDEISGERIPKR